MRKLTGQVADERKTLTTDDHAHVIVGADIITRESHAVSMAVANHLKDIKNTRIIASYYHVNTIITESSSEP